MSESAETSEDQPTAERPAPIWGERPGAADAPAAEPATDAPAAEPARDTTAEPAPERTAQAEPAPETTAQAEPESPPAPEVPAPLTEQQVAPETPPAEAPAAPPVSGTLPPLPPLPPSPQLSPTPIDQALELIDRRPEIGAGAAFAGGLVLALILKRLAN